MSDLERQMKGFYKQSKVYRNLLTNRQAYHRADLPLEQFVSFTKQCWPGEGMLLDLGCGTGETTRRLAARGYNVVGVDVSMLLLQEDGGRSLEQLPHFVMADIVQLPFRSDSVSCIAMHDVVEHIPNTEQLLSEVVRVLRPDGKVIIVSPNLLSPIKPIRHILGIEGFNTKFYGSGLNAFGAIFSNFYLLVTKLLAGQPKFTYRNPLLGDDFQCPDDDAVYLANAIDLKKWFCGKGFSASYLELQFLPQSGGLADHIKSRIRNWLPWLDKGFFLVAQRLK